MDDCNQVDKSASEPHVSPGTITPRGEGRLSREMASSSWSI